jgi:uncharacterized lipoprotein YddW (UPF0748 family)
VAERHTCELYAKPAQSTVSTHYTGLRLTLVRNQVHRHATNNAIQILHVNDKHWIVDASTERGKSAFIYDSLYSLLGYKAAQMVQTNFHCRLQEIQQFIYQE